MQRASTESRRTAWVWAALALALAWSVGLLLLMPGAHTYGSTTLVEENGNGVYVVLAVPLAVSLLVTFALALRRHRGALVTAYVLTGVLAAGNALALLTIGIAVVPVTVGLGLACVAATPSSRPPVASPERLS